MTVRIRFPSLDEIRARAYQIYLTRGSGRSRELDDWLQAEYEPMEFRKGSRSPIFVDA
jgi:hypothetical protein